MDQDEALELYYAAYRYNIPELATHAIVFGLPTWKHLGQAMLWSGEWDPVIGFEGAQRLVSAYHLPTHLIKGG